MWNVHVRESAGQQIPLGGRQECQGGGDGRPLEGFFLIHHGTLPTGRKFPVPPTRFLIPR